MPHFEVLPTNTESSVLEQEEPRRQACVASSAPAFDVAGIDNLLVFWPDKLVALDHLLPGHGNASTAQDRRFDTLLVGTVVFGHSHEASVVVEGNISGRDADVAFHAVQSRSLAVVGSMSAVHHDIGPDSGRSTLPSCPIWLSMLSPASPGELPSLVSVGLSEKDSDNAKANSSVPLGTKVPCAVNLIRYSPPNPSILQFFALESLQLAPVSGMKLVTTASGLLVPDAQLATFSAATTANAASTELQNKFLQLLLLDPVQWRSLRCVDPEQGRMPRGTALRRSIELINRMQARQDRLVLPSGSSIHHGATNGSAADKLQATETSRLGSTIAFIGNAVYRIAIAAQGALRYPIYTPRQRAVLVDGVSQPSKVSKPSPLRLTSVSACARQLDVRISQLLLAPRLASRLRYLRKQQKLPIDEIAAPYIGLWNAIWLIANDIIIGHAASVLLLQNNVQLANLGRGLVERYLLNWVLWLLGWLENWPAGLKLNTELSLFFSDAYSSLTVTWHSHGLIHVLPRLETVIVVMALAGRFMGVTMVLCMLQDLVSICTLHITVFYTLSFRTLRAFVYVLSALFDVFRGKKRNALRGGRLDDASYELDQLLLGTLLFTLVAFLFPTVYVYYLAFGLIRFGVVGFEVGMVETCLGLLNHLPLFALMLRFKDPHRLPAGVWLQEDEPTSRLESAVLPTGRFRLRSRPLAMSDIFEGYGEHVGGLVEVPSMLLRCVLGRPLRRPSLRSS